MKTHLCAALLLLLTLSACSADCGWDGKGLAWLDENGDGRRDPAEPPLENVRFVVDDTRTRQENVCSPAVSDAQGNASFWVFLPGCPDVDFEVYAEPPAGYLPTTPRRLAGDPDKSGETFSFGFARQPGLPAPTPRPAAAIDCTTHEVNGSTFGHVTDIAAAPDGTVWVATNVDLVARFDAGSQARTTFGTPDGIPSREVLAVAVAPNGIVWLATENGAARFDGSAWLGYRPAPQGMFSNRTTDVAVAPGGRVWLTAGWDDVSRYNPETDEWDTGVISGSLLTSRSGLDAVQAPAGRTVWFFGPDSIYELVRRPEGEPDWIVYKRDVDDRPAGLITLNSREAIAAPGDVLWLPGLTASGPSVVRWQVGSGWIVYNQHTTGGAMYGAEISSLALAPDGSLWVGLWDAGALHFTPGPDAEATSGAWQHYSTADGLPFDRVHQVAVAPDGAVWLGGEAGFVARCVEAEFTNIHE